MHRKLATLSILIGLIVPNLVTLAAETEPAKSSAPEGLGLLILLIGLTGFGLVGLTIYGRMMPARAGGNPLEFEDDELIRDDE